MSGLSSVEKHCREVFLQLREYMSPNHGKISHVDHRELSGKVRDCIQMLEFKDYGCDSGKHAGACDCRHGYVGKSQQL